MADSAPILAFGRNEKSGDDQSIWDWIADAFEGLGLQFDAISKRVDTISRRLDALEAHRGADNSVSIDREDRYSAALNNENLATYIGDDAATLDELKSMDELRVMSADRGISAARPNRMRALAAIERVSLSKKSQ